MPAVVVRFTGVAEREEFAVGDGAVLGAVREEQRVAAAPRPVAARKDDAGRVAYVHRAASVDGPVPWQTRRDRYRNT